jgi:hypothetical protein
MFSNIFKKNVIIVIILVTAITLNCCTSPSEAQFSVSVNNKLFNDSPVIVDLDLDRGNLIKIKLDGYQQYTTKATYDKGYWKFSNFEFEEQITLVLDITTGDLYQLAASQLQYLLLKESISASIEKNKFYLVTVIEPEESTWWRNIIRLKTIED